MAAACPVVNPGKLHGVVQQQATIYIFTATKTPNLDVLNYYVTINLCLSFCCNSVLFTIRFLGTTLNQMQLPVAARSNA
jgi:hypothetical protein